AFFDLCSDFLHDDANANDRISRWRKWKSRCDVRTYAADVKREDNGKRIDVDYKTSKEKQRYRKSQVSNDKEFNVCVESGVSSADRRGCVTSKGFVTIRNDDGTGGIKE